MSGWHERPCCIIVASGPPWEKLLAPFLLNFGVALTAPDSIPWLGNVSNSRPLHTRDWEPVTITLQACSLLEKVELVQVRFTLRLRDQRSMWMQDGCKVYTDSYMVSNGSCFMVIWIVFTSHLLEVGLTQNWEIMVVQTLITVNLFYFLSWFRRCLGTALDTSFGLSQFHGHGSWLVFDVALTRGHFTQGPKVVSTKLWEPKRSGQGHPNTVLKPCSVVWGP